MASLDDESKQRLLAKNYSILISMAPIANAGDSNNSPPITCEAPFHFGPAIPEINSIWFKFFLYDMIGDGPTSLLIPHGLKLDALPEPFHYYDTFIVTSWGHDSTVVSHSNILMTLNDLTLHAPVLIESYGINERKGFCTVSVSFNDVEHPFYKHPSIKLLHEQLSLEYFIGYIVLLNPFEKCNVADSEAVDFDQWQFFDLRFGVPLFDAKLNATILNIFQANKLGSHVNLTNMKQASRRLSLQILDFIQQHQSINIFDKNFCELPNQKDDYLIANTTNKNNKVNKPAILIKPTKCILFDEKSVQIVEEFI